MSSVKQKKHVKAPCIVLFFVIFYEKIALQIGDFMSVFLIVFFPLMYFFLKSLKSTKIKFFYDNSLKSFLLGIFISFLYCFIDLLFTSSYKQIPDNFINNLIYFYLFDFFIPFALCFLLVVIASRKSFYHKVLTLLPYFLGFFTIFIPYDCLLKYETTDMFLLFVKPTVFFAMIFSLWILIYLFSQSVKNRSSVGIKILLIFLMILISVVPAVLEILNFLKILFILKLALMILIYFAAILLFFIFVSKSKPEEII